MTELYTTVSGHRVMCGRCRHERGQTRVEGGAFDSENGLTFSCPDCHAIYAICKRCAWYMADGETCARCAANPSILLEVKEPTSLLPLHINEANLVPDPAGRAGHWYDEKSGDVVAMGYGWKPAGVADAPVSEDELPDLSGRSVFILTGRFEGKKGVISESGLGEDQLGVKVIEEGGMEIGFETFEPYLRFMTPEEQSKADAEAAAAKAAQKKTRTARAE